MKTARSSNDRRASRLTLASTVGFSDSLSDEALVATGRNGDEKAFETLVTRHRPRIFALALHYVRVREDAEDVVQQAFQKAFACLHKFKGKSSFSTWLTRIAINEALMLLRRGRARREVSIDEISPEEGTSRDLQIPDSNPDPEARYLQREEVQILATAMAQLRPPTRAAVELRELQELSGPETARHMGVSHSAIKTRLFHGRRKLREILRRSARSPRMSRSIIFVVPGNVDRMSQNRLARTA